MIESETVVETWIEESHGSPTGCAGLSCALAAASVATTARRELLILSASAGQRQISVQMTTMCWVVAVKVGWGGNVSIMRSDYTCVLRNWSTWWGVVGLNH